MSSTKRMLTRMSATCKEVSQEAISRTGSATRPAAKISGLARALAPSPKVLLLDEPLSALDLKLRQAVRLELQQIQHQTGITFIFVTHDQEEALTMSDRIAVIEGGQVQQVGSARDIYELREAVHLVSLFPPRY